VLITNKKIILYIVLLLAILMTACDLDGIYSFEWRLHGTWDAISPSWPFGTLLITFDSINISGCIAFWAFNNIRRDSNLRGYSKDGRIFIQTFGEWQSFPYRYERTLSGAEYMRIYFICTMMMGNSIEFRKR